MVYKQILIHIEKKAVISRNSFYTVVNYLYNQGFSTKYIAEKFNIAPSLVRYVVKNESHVKSENIERLLNNYYTQYDVNY